VPLALYTYCKPELTGIYNKNDTRVDSCHQTESTQNWAMNIGLSFA